MKLSILMPVYNEKNTIREIVSQVLSVSFDKELIIVDDFSNDGTREILAEYDGQSGIQVLYHERNLGKGLAIRTGLAQAEGEVVVIQDADLEYSPVDLADMMERIQRDEAKVVFGSRRLKQGNPRSLTTFFVGGMVLNWIACQMYRIRITDFATCYKMMNTDLLRSLDLCCKRFEFCPEVIAKLAKRNIPILELPISYTPRTIAAGKKIRWRDGIEALWTLIRFRVS